MKRLTIKGGVAVAAVLVGVGGVVGGLAAASSSTGTSQPTASAPTSTAPVHPSNAGLGAWCKAQPQPLDPHTAELCRLDQQNIDNDAQHAAPPAPHVRPASMPSVSSLPANTVSLGMIVDPQQTPLEKSDPASGIVDYSLTTGCTVADGSYYVAVYAGYPMTSWDESASASPDGTIAVLKIPVHPTTLEGAASFYADPATTSTRQVVHGSGDLTATGCSGTVVNLTGADGGTYTYDAATGTLTTVSG